MKSKIRVVAMAVLGLLVTAALVRSQEEAVKPGNGVTVPQVVHEVKPSYTAEAVRARIQGLVGLNVVVKDDGTVGSVTVTRSLDEKYGLDERAVSAMKQWQFKPGTKDGKPVAVRIDVEMTFTLKK
jgi:periplasmic protein TonB